MGKVVYLTGAPASGKSTLAAMLESKLPNTQIFRFGAELTSLVNSRTDVTQEELRTSSANIVTPGDVELIDWLAAEFVREHKSSSHVIIDTHALTRELFGFRMTPISEKLIKEIAPEILINMLSSPEATSERVRKAAKGRAILSQAQLENQAVLQSSITTAYSILCGCPAYFFENEVEEDLDVIFNTVANLLTDGQYQVS